MPQYTSRAELARRAGVSAMAVTKQCRKNLADACDGARVDLTHPSVVAWLESRGRGPTSMPDAPANAFKLPRGRPPEAPDLRSDAERAASPEQATAYLDELGEALGIACMPLLTLQVLIERHGTEVRLKDFLDARKKISDIVRVDLQNDESSGRLIERELVRTHVFGAIEEVCRRLLSDAPATIARTLYAHAASGTPVEKAEREVQAIISKILAPMKHKAARALRERNVVDHGGAERT